MLTEIDVRATLEDKLGELMESYVILGACNPRLAHQALGIDRSIGLLLPCNVVVRAVAAGTVVEVVDPDLLVTATGDDRLRDVANQARKRLAAAVDALAAQELNVTSSTARRGGGVTAPPAPIRRTN